MKVLLLAPYPLDTAPSQRFRFEQYLRPLEEHGVSIEVRPLLDAATAKLLYRPGFFKEKLSVVTRGVLARLRDLVRARSFDLVVIHREAYPLGYPLIERVMGSLGCPYLFDFDDAIYLTSTSDANRLIAPLKYARKTELVARHAALVVAGNEHLASWARQFNRCVTVIPTTIDTDRYQPRSSRREGPPCIGWSGSVTTIAHLVPLAPALRQLQEAHGIRLRVIGDPGFRIDGAQVEALPWREETEREDLSEIDIGIMPLPDEEWARGKCGLKALQYMGLGIATVMSPVGVNAEIANGGAALLASSHDEWVAALGTLAADPVARERLGQAGRARVEERYSVKVNLPRYLAAIHQAAGKPT